MIARGGVRAQVHGRRFVSPNLGHAGPHDLRERRPATRAQTDAVVAAGKQERALAFIELIAGAVGAHFGLDRTEVEARAGAAARKAASTTRATAARRPGKRKRLVRRTGDR